MIHPVRLATTVAALCAMAMASAAPANAPVKSTAQPSASPGASAVRTAASKPPRPGNGWLLPTAQRQLLIEGDLSRSLALADLTGDRTADIVTGNELSLTVGVVLSDRKGRVSDAVYYPIASAGEASLYRVEVAVGHLVGKRYPDIVAAGFSRDTLEVFVGQGAGRFAEPIRVKLGTGDEPSSVAVGDLNRDGRQDIVTGDGMDQAVSVLFGDGKGGFSEPARFPTAAFAGGVVVADATGDGYPDILSAGLDAGVSLLAGNGRGKFHAPVLLSAGPEVSVLRLAVAEVTGDRRVDIVTANQTGGDAGYDTPGSVSVLAGKRAGGFGAAQLLSLGKQTLGRAESVAVGDVTGDGHADIVAGRPVDRILTLLASDGAGGFAGPVDIPGAGGAPDPVAIADVTGDRRPDIVTNVAVGTHEMVAILPTDRAGHVGRWGNFDTRLQLNAESLVGGDFNGDGRPDVATAGTAVDGRVKVAVQLGDGSGGLAAPRHFDLDADSAAGIAGGDANADGAMDLFVVHGGPNAVSVLLGDGEGGFSDPHRYEIALQSQGARAVTVADLTGDGHLDIATANVPYFCLPGDPDCTPPDLGSISILPGDGRGGFGGQIQIEGVARDPSSIAAADATGDGIADLIVPHFDFGDPGLRLLAGDGAGGFGAPVHLTTDFGPVAVAAVDVTGDKHPDLVSLNHTAQTVSLLTGNAKGGFDAAVHFPLYLDQDVASCEPACAWLWPWAWSLVVGDINGDGAPDIATANTNNGTVTVLRNDGSGAFSAIERVHTGGAPRAITLADLTGDGKVDVVTANTEGAVSIHANAR
ncbi:VCBS repeat-containing protein [Lysobacter sp. M15]|uniref:FG-GAP repeat domain-containing protein n=1 Tax=Lysobacter sp. M15 TaxID=2916837 RepID=UPI001F55FC21|nr:VCBS repeat-containing protein [Lysobacter sp. M15]